MYEIMLDAMAPEDLPRDEGVSIFVHDSGLEVTLSADTRSRLLAYIRACWGDGDHVWLDQCLDGMTKVEITPFSSRDLATAAECVELLMGLDEGEHTDYDALEALHSRLLAAARGQS